MRAVVTGAGGFLGRYVVDELLARGDDVVALGRGYYPHLPTAARQIQADVRDLAALRRAFQGADAVFHIAARVGVWGPWREFYETNVVGTRNVIAACRARGVRRLVYTSSPSVIFDGSDQRNVDESHPYPDEWLSPYPHSKKLAEEEILAAHGPVLGVVSLRPHLVWGRGDTSLIPRLIERARAGKLVQVGDGKNLVDVIHVRNAARAHVLAADALGEPRAACGGRAYFLSQGEPVELWRFIAEILERAKLPPVRKRISFATAYNLGRVLEKTHRLLAPNREPRMTRFLAHQLAKDHYYDIGAARRDLGYEPRVGTQAGLDELFA